MTPIHRSVYRAQVQPGQAEAAAAHFKDQIRSLALAELDLLTISIFRWGDQFLTYWEGIERTIAPDALFGPLPALLMAWPGGIQPGGAPLRRFVPMMDIYHSMAPESVEHWRRKQPPERISGRLARLKPEQVSSYIFYHYQYQEEQPGSWDKYGLINLHEDLMFFYQEMPSIVETPRRTGKLTTTNTPDHWQDVMFPHFALWDDAPAGQTIWRDIELVAHRG